LTRCPIGVTNLLMGERRMKDAGIGALRIRIARQVSVKLGV
jgi:hypothetical protein